MPVRPLVCGCVFLVLLGAPEARPKEQGWDANEKAANNSERVPRVWKHESTLRDGDGAPRRGTLGVTFAVYREREGGAALWVETQNVLLEDGGRYSVVLGAATKGGLPADLFATGEPRWLGVQVQLPGEVEQPRVLLASVPYAMKAADADTLGGRPATDYVLREQFGGVLGVLSGGTPKTDQVIRSTSGAAQAMVSGTVNFLGKFTPTGSDVGNSQIFDDGVNVGVGTVSPAAQLDVQVVSSASRNALNTGVTLVNSSAITNAVISALNMQLVDASTAANLSKQSARMVYIRHANATGAVSAFDSVFTTSAIMDSDAPYQLRAMNLEGPSVSAGKTLQTFYGGYIGAPSGAGTVTNKFALVTEAGAGNVGFGTTTPASPLTVAGLIESTLGGFKFPDGTTQLTAAAGGGAGTVTGFATGTGLTGGPITSTGTIAIDTAVVPRLGVANTFTANQTINGDLTLTGSATVTAISGVFDGANGGVFGRDTTSAAGVGVQGIANGANAAGVVGSATATAGAANVGVRGVAAGTNAAGVLAEATNSSGTSAGIRAVTSSPSGTAGRFDSAANGNILEGRTFDILFGSYQSRFRVDFNGFVYGNGFRDLQTGKNVGLAVNCTAGQIMKYDGTTWGCAADGGGAGGSGDVTDVLATFGGGLSVANSSGPQPSVGLITTCGTNQILKWNGVSWGCANDANTGGTGATIVGNNTYLGTTAGNGSTSGANNSAFGFTALGAHTSGSSNSAFGSAALANMTTGTQNAAFGHEAMQGHSGTSRNTAIGYQAFKVGSNSPGTNNTAVGAGAFNGGGGSNNVVLGANALSALPGDVNNVIAIGTQACFNSVASNDICIGHSFTDSSFPGGTIRIGNTTTNPHQAAFIGGIFNQTASGGTTVIINSTGRLGTVLSSQRFKQDVSSIGDLSRRLLQLRPVQFHYKPQYDDGSNILQFGLIAEEVDKVFPELVLYGKDGQPDTVRYHFLAPLLLAETQRLQSEVSELRQQLAAQAAQLAEMKAAMQAMQQAAQSLLAASKAEAARTAARGQQER